MISCFFVAVGVSTLLLFVCAMLGIERGKNQTKDEYWKLTYDLAKRTESKLAEFTREAGDRLLYIRSDVSKMQEQSHLDRSQIRQVFGYVFSMKKTETEIYAYCDDVTLFLANLLSADELKEPYRTMADKKIERWKEIQKKANGVN